MKLWSPVVASLTALLVGSACGWGTTQASPADWTAPGVLAVVQKGDQLYLTNIVVSPASVRTLALIQEGVSANVVPESAIINTSPTRALLFVNDGSNFGAKVVEVDASARSTSVVGSVAAGRFPSINGNQLSAVDVLGGNQPYQRSYSLPGLALRSSAALSFVPSGGDEQCLVGSSPDSASPGLLFQRRTAGAQPVLLMRNAAPGGIACTGDLVAAGIAAQSVPSSSGAKVTLPVPDDRLVIKRGVLPSTTVVVGANPGAVIIINPNLVAVEIDGSGASRSIVFVDLTLNKVVRTVSLDGIDRVAALAVVDGFLVVLGTQKVEMLPLTSGRSTTLPLNGSTATYLISQDVSAPAGA